MKLIRSLFMLAVLSSCSGQIKHKMSAPLLYSPESLGEAHVEIGAGYGAVPAVEVTSDAYSSPPDTSTHRVIGDDRMFFRAGIGAPIPKLKLDLLTEFDRLTLKWQVVGDSFGQAKPGNVSIALLGGATAKHDTGRGSSAKLSKETAISVSPNARYEMKSSGWLVGALVGYRVSQGFLVYTGATRQKHRYYGGYDLVKTPPSKGRFAGHADLTTAHLGIEFSTNGAVFFRLEDAYSVTKLPDFAGKSSDHSLAFLFGANLSLTGE